MDGTEHRFSPSGRLPGGDFRVRRQSCQQDGAEQQRERAAPPGHACASAHGGVSGAQSRFAGADCPAGQPCRPADRRARCPADRRVESVHVSPPFLAAVYAPRRFFMRAGDCPAGASPLASPGLNPGGTYSPNKKGTRRGGVPPTLPADLAAVVSGGGGLSGWLPADRAVPEAAGGRGVFGRLPTLPLVCFVAPIPPAPFPAGRGRGYSFLMQGASPLASPGLNPGGAGSTCWGFLSGRFYKCRKRFSAGVPGAVAPGEINF